jgi:polysaccharide biosynthesis/export protein
MNIMERKMRAIPSRVQISALLSGAVLLAAASAGAQVDIQQKIVQEESARAPGRSANSMIPGSGSQGGSMVPGMVPEQFAHLRLAPGDLLDLNVLDDTDFTGQFRVDEQGNITVPQIGSLHVAGGTTSDAQQQISKVLLDRGLLRNPQVELNLIEYTAPQVTILGEVESPGVFPLLAPESLEDVLALAGGPTMVAGDQIKITPPKSTGPPIEIHYSRQMDAKNLEHVIVHAGDTVQVMRAGIVYVLGSVNRPGGYVMQEDGKLSVLQAVSIAGGTSIIASTGSVYVLRKGQDNTYVWLQLPFKKMTQGKALDVQLRAEDMVYVPTNRFKATVTSTQGILAAATSASIYAGVIY